MVFNESIILGGPLPLVLWNGAIAILALVAFAAVLEGFLWAPMPTWQRLLLLPAIVAVFWPDLSAEIAGSVIILAILVLNRRKAAETDVRKTGTPA